MSKNWKQTGLDIIDPGNVYHDPEEKYGPMHENWAALSEYAKTMGESQLNDPALTDPNNLALLTGSRDYANRVLSGEFLDPKSNLAYAMQLQRGLENAGAFDSQAEASGRYGSGAWGQMKGRNLADLQGNLYGQGLNQMTSMASLAPSLYNMQFAPQDRKWQILNNMANAYAQKGSYDAPYYSQNPVMGGIGTVISAIGAIKGMGGGQQQQQTQGPQTPQYNPSSWQTQGGYSGGSGGWNNWGSSGW